MYSLPNELIVLVLSKIDIFLLKNLCKFNSKIYNLVTYARIPINYNVETECVFKLINGYEKNKEKNKDKNYYKDQMIYILMSSGFIQAKTQILKLALDRKLFDLYQIYLSYYSNDNSNHFYTVSYNIALANTVSGSLEIFSSFIKENPSEKTIKKVLQDSMYISIEKNNRDVFYRLIAGSYHCSNLYFEEIKIDLLKYALKTCKNGKIISDIIHKCARQDTISAIESEIDRGTDIYLGNYHELISLLFTGNILSRKIYNYTLLKCTEIPINDNTGINGQNNYEIMRMLLNDARWKLS